MLFCLMWHNFVALCAIVQLKMTSFSRHIGTDGKSHKIFAL